MLFTLLSAGNFQLRADTCMVEGIDPVAMFAQ